jgi:hypothetical protein
MATLRFADNGSVSFWCPGCNTAHTVYHGEGLGPRWTWNGDKEKPTFAPSIRVTSGHYLAGHDGKSCWCTYWQHYPEDEPLFYCGICHSFVEDGQIKFLSDCTHKLAGQTVPLPEWPETEEQS